MRDAPPRHRVFVLGLDGATLALLKPWADAGKLPHMRKVLTEGAHGILKSTLPPLTPPGWTSAITGVNPGKHNIYSFFKPMRRAYRRQVYSARDIKAPKLWEILGASGKRSIILHLPLTYPVDPLNGLMVAGMMTPMGAAHYTYPHELAEELRRVIADYRLNVDTTYARAGRLNTLLKECLAVTDIQCRETLYLMERKPWDLFFVMLHTPDLVMHMFWKFMEPRHPFYPGPNEFQDAILQCYQRVDVLLGEILERLDESAHLLILSDHGFEMTRKNVFITNWLVHAGYLVLRRSRRLAFKRALFKAGIQRERLVKHLEVWRLAWVAKLFPESIKNQVPRSRPSFQNIEDHIDWTRTRAYFPSAGGSAIYLNVRGREPLGIVHPDGEYAALRDEIMERLGELKDPETGRPVISAIHKREDVFWGEYLDHAPDIMLLPASGYFLNEGLGDEIISPAGRGKVERSGNHHMDGVVMLYGPSIRSGIEIHGARIIDVTPTILYLLGLPVPDYMDGRVLTAALMPDYIERVPVTYTTARFEASATSGFEYTEEERVSLEERLKDLGYM